MSAYRARSSTELIDAGIRLLRNDFTVFFTLSALLIIPIIAVQAVLTPTLMIGNASLLTPPAPGSFHPGSSFLAFLLTVVWSAIIHTAMFMASSDAFLGQPIDIGALVQRALPRATPMAIAYILATFWVSLGFLFFLIPGFLIACRVFAVPSAVAVENAGVAAAFGRSATLSSGIKWHIFWTAFLTILLYVVAYFIVFAAGMWIGTQAHLPILSTCLVALGLIVIGPIIPIVSTLLYYDARIRKEGFDIQLMAQHVSAAPQTA